MDLSNEKELGSLDPIGRENSDSASESGTSGLKSCADCRTTKTPLWRGGPDGPKSLCNACGIRYRKKRREGMGGGVKEKLGFGREMILKKQRSPISNSHSFSRKSSGLKKKWKQRMLGEEEQAAVLLMALSSGLLYA